MPTILTLNYESLWSEISGATLNPVSDLFDDYSDSCIFKIDIIYILYYKMTVIFYK